MDLKSTYNKIAKDWVKDHSSDDWWQEGTDNYLSFLSPGASILDVGCGAGIKSKYISDKGFNVIGIDFSEEMVKLAQKQAPSAKFLAKDIKKPLRFKALFDGVFAQAILLHFPKKEVANILKNIIEPLRPGGYLYAAVKEQPPDGKEEKIVVEEDYGYKYERFFSYFTAGELKNYITGAGLKIVYENIGSSGKTNWIQIIAKN